MDHLRARFGGLVEPDYLTFARHPSLSRPSGAAQLPAVRAGTIPDRVGERGAPRRRTLSAGAARTGRSRRLLRFARSDTPLPAVRECHWQAEAQAALGQPKKPLSRLRLGLRCTRCASGVAP
jgi:hypothetical protein